MDYWNHLCAFRRCLIWNFWKEKIPDVNNTSRCMWLALDWFSTEQNYALFWYIHSFLFSHISGKASFKTIGYCLRQVVLSWGFLEHQLCKRQLFRQKFNCWLQIFTLFLWVSRFFLKNNQLYCHFCTVLVLI